MRVGHRGQPKVNPNLPSVHQRVIRTDARRRNQLPHHLLLQAIAVVQIVAALVAAAVLATIQAPVVRHKEGLNLLLPYARLNRVIAHPLALPNNLRDNPAAPSLQHGQLLHPANQERLRNVQPPNAIPNHAPHNSVPLANRETLSSVRLHNNAIHSNGTPPNNPAAPSHQHGQLLHPANQERLRNVQPPNAIPNLETRLQPRQIDPEHSRNRPLLIVHNNHAEAQRFQTANNAVLHHPPQL